MISDLHLARGSRNRVFSGFSGFRGPHPNRGPGRKLGVFGSRRGSREGSGRGPFQGPGGVLFRVRGSGREGSGRGVRRGPGRGPGGVREGVLFRVGSGFEKCRRDLVGFDGGRSAGLTFKVVTCVRRKVFHDLEIMTLKTLTLQV